MTEADDLYIAECVSKEGIITLDPEGRVTFINSIAKRTLLLDTDQIIGKKLVAVVDFYRFENLIRYATDELPFGTDPSAEDRCSDSVIIGIKQQSDKLSWLSLTIKHLQREDASNLCVLSFFDVSDMVTLNKEIQQKEQHLQTLVSSLDDLVFETTVEGQIIHVWANDESLLFFKAEDIVGKNIRDLFQTELADAFMDVITKTANYKKTHTLEYPSLSNINRDQWFLLQAKPIHTVTDKVMIVISDITNTVRAKEEMRLTQQKFIQAFQHSALGMAIVDLEGRCVEANQSLVDILGYSAEELAQKSFYEYGHPDDIYKDIEAMQQILSGNRAPILIEKRHIHKRGHIIWISITISVICDKNDNPVFFVVQVQDLSLLKKNIETLELQKIQLELTMTDLQTKVRQLEDFNRIVAHNLRGPASNIQMLVEEIERSDDHNEKNEYIRLLKTSSEGLIEILQELISILEIRTQQSVTNEICYFEKSISKIMLQFSAEIRSKGAEITTDLGIKQIPYPRLSLESIILNLFSNALKYNRGNPKIHISTFEKDGSIYLSVQDNGIGIDLGKYGSQIFDFKKIFHRGFDSRGIGLFMTRYQVETLGGRIEVKSEPDKGSIFTVQFGTNIAAIQKN